MHIQVLPFGFSLALQGPMPLRQFRFCFQVANQANSSAAVIETNSRFFNGFPLSPPEERRRQTPNSLPVRKGPYGILFEPAPAISIAPSLATLVREREYPTKETQQRPTLRDASRPPARTRCDDSDGCYRHNGHGAGRCAQTHPNLLNH